MQKIKCLLINVGLLVVAFPVLAFTFVYGMCFMLFSKPGDEPFDIYPKGHPLSRK